MSSSDANDGDFSRPSPSSMPSISIFIQPESATSFVEALEARDPQGDAAAIALLGSGQPHASDLISYFSSDTISHWVRGQQIEVMSPLQIAVRVQSAAVVRALIEEGADLELLVRHIPSAKIERREGILAAAPAVGAALPVVEQTAVAKAVAGHLPPMLDILIEAGADLGRVQRQEYQSVVNVKSALQVAISWDACSEPALAFLAHLLRVSDVHALLPNNSETYDSIMALTLQGKEAIPAFRLLAAHGFDVKALGVVYDGVARAGADPLLAAAARSPDKKLLRYFVKELRLSATSHKVRVMCSVMDAYIDSQPVVVNPELGNRNGFDRLPALTCSACSQVGKVNKCSRCRKVWYCSAKCQKSHWKLVHKFECEANSTT